MAVATRIELVIHSVEQGRRAGRWRLTIHDYEVVCELLGKLERPRPAGPPMVRSLAERTVRLRNAAADLACAAMTTHGELAWMLSECATALSPLTDGAIHPYRLSPAEASDAETALDQIQAFLDSAERHSGRP
ncbi:hypothetical protein [Streptacidiphilus neutrinimicus]|uniref:hypothetical protein n=1 Tax=Streptacidiphilus neutrinimicus TaxID=105420 RepID=UPI0005AA26B3|nr:hypothetical protein [Streptacidiphilus neutrinimicus]